MIIIPIKITCIFSKLKHFFIGYFFIIIIIKKNTKSIAMVYDL